MICYAGDKRRSLLFQCHRGQYIQIFEKHSTHRNIYVKFPAHRTELLWRSWYRVSLVMRRSVVRFCEGANFFFLLRPMPCWAVAGVYLYPRPSDAFQGTEFQAKKSAKRKQAGEQAPSGEIAEFARLGCDFICKNGHVT